MNDVDDLDALLDGATPAFEDVKLYLDGARRAEWNALVLAATQPESESPDDRFGMASKAATARKQLEALSDELRDRILTVRIIAMPGDEWAALKTKYKPREGNSRDLSQGYNMEAVARQALLTHGKRVVGDDVRDISAGQWSKILKAIGGGDFDTLVYGVIGVNQLIGQQFVGQLVKGSPATSSSAGK